MLVLIVLLVFLVIDGLKNKSKDMAEAADGSPGAKPLESLGLTTALRKPIKLPVVVRKSESM